MGLHSLFLSSQEYKRMSNKNQKVVLVTGGARRIGASIAEYFHLNGYRVIVHYRHSKQDAETLIKKLNERRDNFAAAISADLDNFDAYEKLIFDANAIWHRLDVLINNASTFFPTPVGKTNEHDWNLLLNSNLKAPFFLSQAAAPLLAKNNGNIINIVDTHANKKPMKNYPLYSCAKAGLAMLTQSLALELAPQIRVNAVAPGHVIWPENKNAFSDAEKKAIEAAVLLQKEISPMDIAQTAFFLAEQASITGQMISVDAGMLLSYL